MSGSLATYEHELINDIDTKAKCRHLKQPTGKGTLRQELFKVRPSFVNCYLFNLLS
jgi:hypothetical protein